MDGHNTAFGRNQTKMNFNAETLRSLRGAKRRQLCEPLCSQRLRVEIWKHKSGLRFRKPSAKLMVGFVTTLRPASWTPDPKSS